MLSQRSESQFFIGVIVLTAVLVALIFLPELNVIVLGVSFAVLFQPWYTKLRGWFGGKDSLAAALIVILAIALILLPLMFFGLQIFLEAQGLYGHLASGSGVPVINWFRAELQQFFPALNINFSLYVQQALGIVIGNLGPIFSGVLGVVGTFFLSFFALYYFLKDGPALRAELAHWSPLPAEHTEEIFDRLHAMASSVIRGSLLVSVLYGLLVGIGFFIFGLPSAILWGAVTAIAAFIPVFGVYLIVVPGIVSLAIGGHGLAAIGLTAWVLVMSLCME
ncbi:MAG TPA: AI-2E family transporter, partial [Candidatus Paceibacterota bacterium]|nr:AI-2E family transporter [Candidatus Paceibacterota bacterium]